MPRTSSESLSRCRQCGAPLVNGKRRSVCPRCHPEEVVPAPQMEFLLSAPEAEALPFVEPEVGPELAEPEVEPDFAVSESEPEQLPDLPPTPPDEVISAPFEIGREPWTVRHWLATGTGALIVVAGLSWAGFQMWPRGSVERSIVQAFEALPHFTERTGDENPLGALTVGGDSSAAFVDLEGDGLLDLVTGSQSGEIRVYLNAGTRIRPRFLRASGDVRGLVTTDTSNSLAFADLRGTGTSDALNAGKTGTPTFFANRGTRKNPDFLLIGPEQDPFAVTVAPARSYDWRPAFADIDHDGDFDLFIGTRDGSILFCENRGAPQRPQFQGITRVNPFGLRGVGDLVSISFGDLDGDGDLDAVTGNALGEMCFLENRGNAWRPQFVLTPAGTLGLTTTGRDATVALVDLDGDGDLDCITGGADGRFRYFENLSTSAATSAGKAGPP